MKPPRRQDSRRSAEIQLSRWSLDVGIDMAYLQQQLGYSSLITMACSGGMLPVRIVLLNIALNRFIIIRT